MNEIEDCKKKTIMVVDIFSMRLQKGISYPFYHKNDEKKCKHKKLSLED